MLVRDAALVHTSTRWRPRGSCRHRQLVVVHTHPSQPARSTVPFDVSSVTVTPSFRAAKSFDPARLEAETRPVDAPVRLLFLSEGNTCRSVLAEGFLTRLLTDRGLEAQFSCESKGTRDYNAGEGCDAATRAVGPAFGLHYLEYHVARATDFAVDINAFDVLLPVDKFTAADVLRECTVYATVNPQGGYVAKVRTLAEFNPSGRVSEIDDPLYGALSSDGPEEVAAVTACATLILACCEGLVDRLEAIAKDAKDSGQPVRPLLAAALANMKPVDWVRPPMLSKPLTQGDLGR